MLSEFVGRHRDEIIARCRARVAGRMAPGPTPSEREHGIPLFLAELEHTLASELGERPAAATAAVAHGSDLLRRGFTIAQVVDDYGDVCQTITELAIERNASIRTDEFRALNKCLDDAIACAVTEYQRQHELALVAEGARRSNEYLGGFAHQVHNLLGSAMLAFDVLRAGSVGIQGSTGDVLERSLVGLRDLVDRSLTEVRLAAGTARPERIAVARFLEDIEASAVLGAHARRLRLTVTQVDPDLTVETDRQILSSVMSRLLQNAFEHTRPHTHVWLHTHASADRLVFEIEDQRGEPAHGAAGRVLGSEPPHGGDLGALSPGLALCVRGVTALGGALRVRNQNSGCVVTVDLPRSPA